MGRSITGYSPRAGALVAHATGLMYLGRLEEARREGDEVIRLLEEAGQFEPLIWMLQIRVTTAHASGVLGMAIDQARRCLDIGKKIDVEYYPFYGNFALGAAFLIEGRSTEARDALIVGREAIGTLRTMYGFLPWILAFLADAHLALDEHSEALAAAREGTERGRNGGCIYFEASAQIALAKVLIATGGAEARAEIEAALDRAEKLVASIEARSLSPRILELRGRLAAALGDTTASEQTLREALDLYREIGATGHAERLGLEIQPTSSQGEHP